MVLRYEKPHHLGKLHEELLNAVPALRPQPGPSGEMRARLLVRGDGRILELTVPDDLAPGDIAAIDAVVQAHNPVPPPQPPDPDEMLTQAMAGAKTVQELVAVLSGKVAPVRVKAEAVEE